VLPLSVLGASLDETEGELIMGQANVVREHATIYAGPGQPTRIGTDNLIMIGCQIDAGATLGDHGIFVNGTHIGARAKIEDYVRTSSFVVVYPGVTVGAYTFTLGYGEMDRDCPPFAMVQGSPYRVRGVNAENLRRCGFGENDIRDLKAAFREIFTGPDDAPDAVVLKRMSADKTHPHLMRLAESIQAGLNGRSAT
jgi:UDP-N-acetylglucosamine acyltransferase